MYLSVKKELKNDGRKNNTMNTQIKHWIIVLERIKTLLLLHPLDNDPAVEKVNELIKEMEGAQEEMEKKI